MINRVHIFGASGSGTTTLAKHLSIETGYLHLDTDDYYWLPTKVPFTENRSIEERQMLLKKDLDNKTNWILSGSLCGWGDIFIPCFELVVYLWIPKDVRIKRLIEREKKRYGTAIEPNGARHKQFNEFIEWASKYDEGGLDVRSRLLHDTWLSNLKCPVLTIEGDVTVEERMNIVLDKMNKDF